MRDIVPSPYPAASLPARKETRLIIPANAAPLSESTNQQGWRLAGLSTNQQIYVSLRFAPCETGRQKNGLWIIGLYAPSQRARLSCTWPGSKNSFAPNTAQLDHIAQLLAYLHPSPYTAFLLKCPKGTEKQHAQDTSSADYYANATAAQSTNALPSAFDTLASFLTVPSLGVQLCPVGPTDMQEAMISTQSPAVWALPSHPTTTNSLGDLVSVGQLVENFFQTLLEIQTQAINNESCSAESARLCQKMARIFNGDTSSYNPVPHWTGVPLAKIMQDNSFIALPAADSHESEEIMMQFFTMAGLQALSLYQAREENSMTAKDVYLSQSICLLL